MKTSSARTSAPISATPANDAQGHGRPAPPKPRVSIADRAGHAFPPHTIVHGFTHQTRGDVEIAEMTTVAVVAKIRGARTETVTLRENTGALLAGCTCPARSLGLDVCKHQWATLLEADRLGGLSGLRTAVTKLDVRPLDVAPEKGAAPPETGAAPARNVEATKAPSGPRRPKRPRTKPSATQTAKAENAQEVAPAKKASAKTTKAASRRVEPEKPTKSARTKGTSVRAPDR